MAIELKRPAPLPYSDPDAMPDQYAITGAGTCMAPLIPDGAVLVVDKTEPPKPGDVVVLHFKPEHASQYGFPGWIKRLVMPPPPEGFSGWLAVEQLTPHRVHWVPTDHVARLHKALGLAEAAGDGRARYRRKDLGFQRGEVSP